MEDKNITKHPAHSQSYMLTVSTDMEEVTHVRSALWEATPVTQKTQLIPALA